MSNLKTTTSVKINYADLDKTPEAFVKVALSQTNIRTFGKLGGAQVKELKKEILLQVQYFAKLVGHPITDKEILKGIVQMIVYRYGSLAPSEIAYAFRQEAQLPEGEAVEHFGKVNIKYFSTILDRYVKRRQDIRRHNKIQKEPEPEAEPMDQEEVENLLRNGVRQAWQLWVTERRIEHGRLWIFDHIQDQKDYPGSSFVPN